MAREGPPEVPPPNVHMSSAEVNLLLARYCEETGLAHTAFALVHESGLDRDTIAGSNTPLLDVPVPSGQLIRVLQRGLLYLEAEARWRGEDTMLHPPRLIESIPGALPFSSLPRQPSTPLITNGRAGEPSVPPEAQRDQATLATPAFEPPAPKASAAINEDVVMSSALLVNTNAMASPSPLPGRSAASTPARLSSPEVEKDRRQSFPASKRKDPDPPKAEDLMQIDEAPNAKRARVDSPANPAALLPLVPVASTSKASATASPEVPTQLLKPPLSIPRPNPDSKKSTTIQRSPGSQIVTVKTVTTARPQNLPSRRSSSPVLQRRQRSRSPPSATAPLSARPALTSMDRKKATTAPMVEKAKVREDRRPPPGKGPPPTLIAKPHHVIKLKGGSVAAQPCSWNPKVEGMLATGAGDGIVRIYEIPNTGGATVEETNMCKHVSGQKKADIPTVQWNGDGTLLATGCDDGVARTWTPDGELYVVLSMHSRSVFIVRWNESGSHLLTGSLDHSVVLWELSTGKAKSQWTVHTDSVLDVQWYDNQHFASCSVDTNILLFNINRSSPIRRLIGHKDEVNAIRFDPTKTLVASSSDDMTVRVWTLVGLIGPRASEPPPEDGEDVSELDRKGGCVVLEGHRAEVHTLDWMPGAGVGGRRKLLVSASFDHSARVWDIETMSCLYILDRHVDRVYSIAFKPVLDADIVVTASNDNRVCFWSLKTGKLISEYEHGGEIYEIAWHPSRDQLAVCGEGAVVLTLSGLLS